MRGHVSREIRYSTTSDDDNGSIIMENAEVYLYAIVFHCCFIFAVL